MHLIGTHKYVNCTLLFPWMQSDVFVNIFSGRIPVCELWSCKRLRLVGTEQRRATRKDLHSEERRTIPWRAGKYYII